MDVEYALSLPEISTYCDVHVGKGVPGIKMQRIFDYFLESEKSFTQKYHQLYKQRYISILVHDATRPCNLRRTIDRLCPKIT